MIPEFVGRLPVHHRAGAAATATLVRILTEPKNALVKQYQRFFEMEGCELEFTAGGPAGHRREGHEARHRRPGPARRHGRDHARPDVPPARGRRERQVRRAATTSPAARSTCSPSAPDARNRRSSSHNLPEPHNVRDHSRGAFFLRAADRKTGGIGGYRVCGERTRFRVLFTARFAKTIPACRYGPPGLVLATAQNQEARCKQAKATRLGNDRIDDQICRGNGPRRGNIHRAAHDDEW